MPESRGAERAGIDYFRITGITGHTIMSVFKRYNTLDEADLRQAMSQMDTYMDTSAEPGTSVDQVSIWKH